MEWMLPDEVSCLLRQLEAAGHSAYAVGGCVRDTLLGRVPGDWDICTGARPEEIRAVFAGERLILTGEKHGTVAVVRAGVPYEITTYRVDGAYADRRHPGSVRFVPQVEEDLARRDFTINAMAYHPARGLVDVFGGRGDLLARMVRCVGDPAARFGEDALRILRAVRFASQLDFSLEKGTAAAALHLKDTVQGISAERVYTELDKLLAGPAAGRVLAEYGPILAGAVPEIGPCIGCGQPSLWHCYDVWQHTAAAVAALPPDAERVVRWAVLLHDLAKPACKSVDEAGVAHFYGHNQRGGRLAQGVLRRLKAPRALENSVAALVAVHDCPLPADDSKTLHLLARHGPVFLRRLCAVKYADLAAHAARPAVEQRRQEVAAFEARLERLAKSGCYRLGDLAVNGSDLLEAGVRPGPQVGLQLERLLEAVMDGSLPNEREALLAQIKENNS